MNSRLIKYLIYPCIIIIYLSILISVSKSEKTIDVSITDNSTQAFSHPIKTLNTQQKNKFIIGKSLFHGVGNDNRTLEQRGIGPDYNAVTCASCHVNDGRGDPKSDRSTVILLYNTSTKDQKDPIYGGQLRDGSVNKLPQAAIDYSQQVPSIKQLNYGSLDKDSYTFKRIAPEVFGMGLIEAIPDSFFLAKEDPNDANGDGISGRISYVNNKIARFGWTASRIDTSEQVLRAAYMDMGLTNSQHSEPGKDNELTKEQEAQLILYTRSLAPPRQRKLTSDGRKGQKIFRSIGCSSCHIEKIEIKRSDILRDKRTVIYPFSDFLLHNMGSALSDPTPMKTRNGDEFRTAPLWGLGKLKEVNGSLNLLHDGRAKSEDEAIKLHAGEALSSKHQYELLPQIQKHQIIEYINSL